MRSFSKGVVYGRFQPRKALAGEYFSVWLVGRLSLINMGGGCAWSTEHGETKLNIAKNKIKTK